MPNRIDDQTTKKIIAALRCEGDCSGCKYYVLSQDKHTGEITDCCNDGLLHKDAAELIEQFSAAFRAQEQNEPLTCDGCAHEHCPWPEIEDYCYVCKRSHPYSDRYEPKGE